ncbi:hypothetical protein CQ010_01550 [Arthrobacter sp. MYb211]|nr:hypothetical protein CQ015_03805 [Arthrobacter sp. MYb221]PRC10556.1 hypothetical protein CQ010_01550 [Arthrobacter sp. MYb211]
MQPCAVLAGIRFGGCSGVPGWWRGKSTGGSSRADGPLTLDDIAPFGRGRRDPVTGRYERYVYPPDFREQIKRRGGKGSQGDSKEAEEFEWSNILAKWNLIELDLHEVFGIDIFNKPLMKARTYAWLRRRIEGLLTTDSRLSRAFRRSE